MARALHSVRAEVEEMRGDSWGSVRVRALAIGLALVALMSSRASAQSECAEGLARGPRTAGRCCWPGQSWARDLGRCEGPPSSCPAGLVAEGDACVAGIAPAQELGIDASPVRPVPSAPEPSRSGTGGCPSGYAPMRGSCAPVAPSTTSTASTTTSPILVASTSVPPTSSRSSSTHRTAYTSGLDGERAPVQSRESHAFRQTRPLWELFGTAVGLWVASYVTGIVIAAVTSDAERRGATIGYFAVPLAGPWICIAACHHPEAFMVPLIVDGIMQPILLVLTIVGAVVQVPVRGDSASRPLVMPFANADSGGLVVSGAF